MFQSIHLNFGTNHGNDIYNFSKYWNYLKRKAGKKILTFMVDLLISHLIAKTIKLPLSENGPKRLFLNPNFPKTIQMRSMRFTHEIKCFQIHLANVIFYYKRKLQFKKGGKNILCLEIRKLVLWFIKNLLAIFFSSYILLLWIFNSFYLGSGDWRKKKLYHLKTKTIFHFINTKLYL